MKCTLLLCLIWWQCKWRNVSREENAMARSVCVYIDIFALPIVVFSAKTNASQFLCLCFFFFRSLLSSSRSALIFARKFIHFISSCLFDILQIAEYFIKAYTCTHTHTRNEMWLTSSSSSCIRVLWELLLIPLIKSTLLLKADRCLHDLMLYCHYY